MDKHTVQEGRVPEYKRAAVVQQAQKGEGGGGGLKTREAQGQVTSTQVWLMRIIEAHDDACRRGQRAAGMQSEVCREKRGRGTK